MAAADRVIEGLDSLPPAERESVVTVGNFDGVHLGHRRILQAARDRAGRGGVHALAVTFDPDPEVLLFPQRPVELILPHEVKYRLLLEAGADRVVVVKTTPEFLALSPRDFVRRVVVERFLPVCAVEGPDFRFGRGRAGNIATLRRLAGEGGFEVVEVDPVRLDLPGRGQVRISSSLVRDLLRAGDVESAAKCLGRRYALHGRVGAGRRVGRLLDFPTANVEAPGLLVPADGVYAGRADVAGGTYPAAVSIGSRPTFGPGERAVEAHLVGARGDFYGQPVALTLLVRLRDQQRFPDAESLRRQITKDVQRVRETCRQAEG